MKNQQTTKNMQNYPACKSKSLIEKTRFLLTFDVFVTHAALSSPSDLIPMVIKYALYAGSNIIIIGYITKKPVFRVLRLEQAQLGIETIFIS